VKVLTDEFIALALDFAHDEIVSQNQAFTRPCSLKPLFYGGSSATASSVTFVKYITFLMMGVVTCEQAN